MINRNVSRLLALGSVVASAVAVAALEAEWDRPFTWLAVGVGLLAASEAVE